MVVRWECTVSIRWGCFVCLAVLADSHWGSVVRPGRRGPCGTVEGCAKAGSAGNHSSGSPDRRDLYVTGTTSRNWWLSLCSI